MLVVIVHLTAIVIDIEEAAAVIEAEDIITETMIERGLVCVHEAEVQRDIRTELIDTAVVVVAEIDQENVWVVVAEEIDINCLFDGITFIYFHLLFSL